MAVLRAITLNCSGALSPSCVIISSVKPSLRYSWLGSPLRFSNGVTRIVTWRGALVAWLEYRNHPNETRTNVAAPSKSSPAKAEARRLDGVLSFLDAAGNLG